MERNSRNWRRLSDRDRCFFTDMTPKVDIKRVSQISNLKTGLDALRRLDVLVGIPQATTGRRGGAINNASLMFIHTHGSPVRNIPARAVIEPAIAADGNREVIAEELKKAAGALFEGLPDRALVFMRRAGQAGVNASKAWFTDPRNHWAPNRPATIRRKGSDRPLIDTGALRRSITYVVREHP